MLKINKSNSTKETKLKQFVLNKISWNKTFIIAFPNCINPSSSITGLFKLWVMTPNGVT